VLNREWQLFFESVELHLQLADLLVEFRLARFVIHAFTLPAIGEDFCNAFKQLFLPQADLRGMHAEGRHQLAGRPIALDRRKRYLGLKRRLKSLPLASHPNTSKK
jgi:hypothetical protein